MTPADPRRRMIRTLLLFALIVLILLPATRQPLFERHLFRTLDAQAIAYVDDGLVRAGVAFATARAFNALISVFQESQLQLEPGGVGVSLALGAALDPANDLIERFSWVMLASLTSLGVQKVLIEITPFVSVQLVLMLALLALIAGLWQPAVVRFDFARLGRVLLLVAVLLRFAVPVMAMLNQQVYLAFLGDRYTDSIAVLDRTVERLEADRLDEPVPGAKLEGPVEESDWWGRTRQQLAATVDQGKRFLDLQARLEVAKQAALQLIDRVVDLIVVFVLSTIVLPLLFLWGVLKLGRLILGSGVG